MPPQSPKDALILLLHRSYEGIAALEQALGITVSKTDWRPRIEYFHDAVRDYASGQVPLHIAGTRLAVEQLGKDAQALKAIQTAPLSPGTTHRRPPADQTPALPGSPATMHPSEARAELSAAYKPYAVFFVALLAEAADRNAKTRIETKNAQMEEIGALEQEARGKDGVDMTALVQEQVYDQELKAFLLRKLAAAQTAKKKHGSREAMAFLKAQGKTIDATIAGIDKAHFAFAKAQLGFYEQSKDVVKQLAGQGLNLAGKFLAEAMSAAIGRGGRGF